MRHNGPSLADAVRDLIVTMSRRGNAIDLIRDYATDTEHTHFLNAFDHLQDALASHPQHENPA